jgi:glycopeptide antibiotics resistance protein
MRARWVLLAAGAYGLVLALIALCPTPVDRNVAVTELGPVAWLTRQLGLQPWEGYHLVEASANVVLFVPLGVLVLLWRTDWGWLPATLLAFAVTVGIEVLQDVLRPERVASAGDVVANTLGGAIGALLVVAARTRVPMLRR